jgi:putative peptidoglycan lipid II flippase
LLYYHLRKAGVYHLQPGWLSFLVKLSLALLVMALVLYYVKGDTAAWLQFSILQRLLYITGLVTLGSVSYFATLFALGFRPRDFMRRVVH